MENVYILHPFRYTFEFFVTSVKISRELYIEFLGLLTKEYKIVSAYILLGTEKNHRPYI